MTRPNPAPYAAAALYPVAYLAQALASERLTARIRNPDLPGRDCDLLISAVLDGPLPADDKAACLDTWLRHPRARTDAFLEQTALLRTIFVHDADGGAQAFVLERGEPREAPNLDLSQTPLAGRASLSFLFHGTDDERATALALEEAARCLPADQTPPVYWHDSEPATTPRRLSGHNFFDGALAITELPETFGNFRLAVVQNTARHRLNFNARGHLRRLATFQVQAALQEGSLHPPTFSVLVDASENDGLCTRYWEDTGMQDTDRALDSLLAIPARVTLYRYLAGRPDVLPTYAQWQEARGLGVDYPEPKPLARAWQPRQDGLRHASTARAFDPQHTLLCGDLESPHERLLMQAAGKHQPPLFLALGEDFLDGYSWSALTRRVEDVGLRLVDNPSSTDIPVDPLPEDFDEYEISIDVQPAAPTLLISARAPVHSRTDVLDVPLDYAFTGALKSYPACALYLREGTEASPEGIAEDLAEAYFEPTDGADTDNAETQYLDFQLEALRAVLAALKPPAEAHKTLVLHLCRRFLASAGRDDFHTVVRFAGKDITVDVSPRKAD